MTMFAIGCLLILASTAGLIACAKTGPRKPKKARPLSLLELAFAEIECGIDRAES